MPCPPAGARQGLFCRNAGAGRCRRHGNFAGSIAADGGIGTELFCRHHHRRRGLSQELAIKGRMTLDRAALRYHRGLSLQELADSTAGPGSSPLPPGAVTTGACRQRCCPRQDEQGGLLLQELAGSTAGPGSSPLPAGQHFRYAAGFHQADRPFQCLIYSPDYGIEAFIINNIACNIGLYLGVDYFA